MKIYPIVFIILLAFSGCDTTTSKQSDLMDIAYIKIPLPRRSSNRAVLSDQDLSQVNIFKIASYKNSGASQIYRDTATLEDEYLELQVVPGIYDIVIMAGINKKTYSEDDNILLATGFLESINILPGDNTFEIILKGIDRTVEFPNYVETGTEFNGQVNFDFRNKFISHTGFSIYIVSIDSPPSFSSFYVNGNTLAPLIPGNGKAILYPSHAYVKTSIYEDSGMAWSLPFEQSIVFYDGSNAISDIHVDIRWED
jgi:hypothetical protein